MDEKTDSEFLRNAKNQPKQEYLHVGPQKPNQIEMRPLQDLNLQELLDVMGEAHQLIKKRIAGKLLDFMK